MSSMFWMLLLGYQLYKNIVIVFVHEFSKWKIYLTGYGIPLIICLSGLSIIYMKENILMEALFDKRYNHL